MKTQAPYCEGPASRAAARRSPRGFTLVELITVMAVAGILLAIATPSFRTFSQNTRLTSEANIMVYSLNMARSSAVKLDQRVEVCASADGATCNGAWASGWIVCYPVANCGGAGGAPTVLQVSPAINAANTVSEQIGAALAVIYQSNGQTSIGPGGASYRFVFCDNRGAGFGQDVEVNPIGRIQSGAQGKSVSGVALGGC
jgi:type IV fimbrial biogenesis protein FimT